MGQSSFNSRIAHVFHVLKRRKSALQLSCRSKILLRDLICQDPKVASCCRLKAALQLSSKRGGSSGMLASPIAPSAKPIRLGRQTSDVRAGSSVNTASPTAFGASTRLPATRSLQQQPAASAPVAEPSSPYSALRKPRQPASEQMFAKGAGGNSQVISQEICLASSCQDEASSGFMFQSREVCTCSSALTLTLPDAVYLPSVTARNIEHL